MDIILVSEISFLLNFNIIVVIHITCFSDYKLFITINTDILVLIACRHKVLAGPVKFTTFCQFDDFDTN